MIQTSPLGFHKTMADYTDFIIKRHNIVLPQVKKGTSDSEVHIIFDTPGRLPNTQKYLINIVVMRLMQKPK